MGKHGKKNPLLHLSCLKTEPMEQADGKTISAPSSGLGLMGCAQRRDGDMGCQGVTAPCKQLPTSLGLL